MMSMKLLLANIGSSKSNGINILILHPRGKLIQVKPDLSSQRQANSMFTKRPEPRFAIVAPIMIKKGNGGDIFGR